MSHKLGKEVRITKIYHEITLVRGGFSEELLNDLKHFQIPAELMDIYLSPDRNVVILEFMEEAGELIHE
jgi:hypothetical protein